MEKTYPTINFIKKNTRYFLATGAIILMFLISRSFPAEVITSESCAGGDCKAVLQDSNLTDKNPDFYANDAFRSNSGEYYRLTFQSRASQDSKILVKVSNSINEEKELGVLNIQKTKDGSSQEVVFSTDKQYTDILFQKEEKNNGADISISGIHISKLNISSEKEFASLKPTVRGKFSYDVLDQEQLDNSKGFDQLKESGMILGQIIKPQSDYIAGVTLDFDIIKQDNNGGKKYKFELREAEFDGGVPEVTSNVLASVDFTVENVEGFRQDDGKFKFPIFARLDQEKYYFIGINNNNVAVDKFNYLRLKGTENFEKYVYDGAMAVKTKGKTYAAIGNLYFITHGLNFAEYQGKKILGGEIIEDIGRGQGKFSYQADGTLYDLADLFSYTPDASYDDGKKIIFGKIEEGNNPEMIYKFDTIFPASRFRLTGKQADAEWSKVSMAYSYDNSDWKEIPAFEDGSDNISHTQSFDHSWSIAPARNEIYVKITPKEPEGKEKYGVVDFKLEGDILMK